MGTIIQKYSQLLLLVSCFTLFSCCDFKPASASLEGTVWEHEFSLEEQNPDGIKKAVIYFNNQTLTYYALSADGRKKHLIASYPYTLEQHLLTAGNQHAIVDIRFTSTRCCLSKPTKQNFRSGHLCALVFLRLLIFLLLHFLVVHGKVRHFF